jgi:hypothetical protein
MEVFILFHFLRLFESYKLRELKFETLTYYLEISTCNMQIFSYSGINKMIKNQVRLYTLLISHAIFENQRLLFFNKPTLKRLDKI